MPPELNLLPPARRRFLVRQLVTAALRRVIQNLNIACVVITVAGLSAIGFLQFMITTSSSTASTVLSQKIKTYQEVKATITYQNGVLKTMANLSSQRLVWSAMWPNVLTALPPGTFISSINADGNNPVHLSLAGQAPARSALVVFADRLRLIPWVAVMNAPDSNLLERDNPHYQFDVSVKKPALTTTP